MFSVLAGFTASIKFPDSISAIEAVAELATFIAAVAAVDADAASEVEWRAQAPFGMRQEPPTIIAVKAHNPIET